ncbi:MAG TPA: T9SS type A sorting domain-containing protein [Verrucomicrobiae bacterium]|nr:T9SS type A sorting domain-containing protein [Verrucomicrobiae bacterium]
MRRFLFGFLTLFLFLPLSTFGSTLPESEPNFRFAIDQTMSYLGAEVGLSIRNISEPSKPGVGKGTAIGSFSFLINYDDRNLELIGVRLGKVLDEQGWEITEITQPAACSLGGDCRAFAPVLITAMAESKHEDGHPQLTRQNVGEWLVLRFKVKNDCTLSGQILPVSWHWRSCYDNRLMDFPENRVWMVDSLINFVGNLLDLKAAFPLDISSCDTLSFDDRKVRVERGITFVNGGIGIPNPDGCNNDRGDLNLNGIAYEIADYVLYQNYFLYGDSVLFSDSAARQAQIAASDVNGDAQPLRVADLVHIARVIMGDANPLPKPALDTLSDSAYFTIIPSSRGLLVHTLCKQDIGGVFIRLKSGLPFGPPSILDTAINLELSYQIAHGELRVLLSPDFDADSARIPRYKRQVLLIPYRSETLDSFEIHASTYDGRELPVSGTFYVPPPLPSLENCPTEDTIRYGGPPYSVDFGSDREGEPNVRYILEYGPGTIDSITGLYTLQNTCNLGKHGIVVQLIVRSNGPSLLLGYCKFFLLVNDHSPDAIPAQQTVTVSHGQMATNQIQVSDPDSGDAFTFTQTYGPGAIDSNGVWTYQTTCKDVGASPQIVSIQINDGYGSCTPGPLTANTSFHLVVTNAAPSILCPPNAQIQVNRLYQVQVKAQDADPADTDSLTFSLVSGPAGLTVSPSGLVQWTPYAADFGVHQICLMVTDLCGASSQCCYTLNVIEGSRFLLAVDTITAQQGTDAEVSIRNLNEAADPSLVNGKTIGGFSFLMSYDCACLQFLATRKGALLVEQDWEFFTYRYGAVGNGNCGSGCPSCLIRIVAIADVNDGNQPNWTRENKGELAVLKFRTSADRVLAGQFCPISWFWFDCSDNTISDSTGQRLWTVNALYDVTGAPINLATSFPTNVSACTTSTSNGPQAKKFIDFVNGGIRLPQPPYDEFRGDLNLNGISFEVADFELFKNYFPYGDLVFYPDSVLKRLQILNSDVNGDGLVLDISDLVTMARILTGDANPLPRGEPKPVNVSFTKEGPNLIVTTNSFYDLGGLFLRLHLAGTTGTPVKLDSAVSLEIKENSVGGEMRILLVASQKDARIPPGTRRVLSIPCDSLPTPVEVSACDYYGIALPTFTTLPANVEIGQQPAPTSFGLSQNFPNPFNPSTSFSLTLPKAGRYSVRIYNLTGQVVNELEGEATAGRQILTWDGTDQNGKPVSSGIYFYKAEAAGYSETKKMILIR